MIGSSHGTHVCMMEADLSLVSALTKSSLLLPLLSSMVKLAGQSSVVRAWDDRMPTKRGILSSCQEV